jgi:hypothetical protein
VGNWRKENADDLEDSFFANNPFLDELLERRPSPEGQQFAQLADALCDLMEDVRLDAKQRRFISSDRQRLDLDQSVGPVPDKSMRFRITSDFPSANAPGASASFRCFRNANGHRSPSASVGPDARDHSLRWHL